MTPELEPGGLGHELLLEWAPWARDERRERESWCAEWSARPRIERGYDGDAPPNFWIVDRILAPLKRDKSVYWTVCAHWYLGEESYARITEKLGRDWPEKRIRLNLVCLGELVAREYLDFKQLRTIVSADERSPRSPVTFVA
jgi:hypothetical protein